LALAQSSVGERKPAGDTAQLMETQTDNQTQETSEITSPADNSAPVIVQDSGATAPTTIRETKTVIERHNTTNNKETIITSDKSANYADIIQNTPPPPQPETSNNVSESRQATDD
jgi:hypothetical protein